MASPHRYARRILRPAALACLGLALGGCAATNSPCYPGEAQHTMDSLYFGTAMPGGQVSVTDWELFRDEVIGPRFPRGMTSFAARGQWQGQSGKVESENSYVLQVVHQRSPQVEAAIVETVSLYKARFRQESVLRVRSATCVSF